jgi:heme-degrading monooxygenase HmoA
MSAIIRVWYGTAHREHADDYANHVKNDIFPKFAKMKGNRGAKVLRRDVEDGVEFMVVTRWASLDAVRDFAKDELDKAVVAEVAQPYFIRYDDRVSHFTVAYEMGQDSA